MGGETRMVNEVHLRHPLGGTFCGIEGYLIYTKKGKELADLDRLVEVTCLACLIKGMKYYKAQSLEQMGLHNEVSKAVCKLEENNDVVG